MLCCFLWPHFLAQSFSSSEGTWGSTVWLNLWNDLWNLWEGWLLWLFLGIRKSQMEHTQTLMRQLASGHCRLLIFCFELFGEPRNWGASLSSLLAWYMTLTLPHPLEPDLPIPLDPYFIYIKLLTVTPIETSCFKPSCLLPPPWPPSTILLLLQETIS